MILKAMKHIREIKGGNNISMMEGDAENLMGQGPFPSQYERLVIQKQNKTQVTTYQLQQVNDSDRRS